MAAADYRLMTEATGQRIAAALEALSGFGAYLTTADVVNNLTSTATDKPLSAAQGKALNDKLEAEISLPSGYSTSSNNKVYKVGKVVHFSVALLIPEWTTKRLSINGLIPSGFTPSIETNFTGMDNANDIAVSCLIESNGNLSVFRNYTTSCTSLRLGVTYLT